MSLMQGGEHVSMRLIACNERFIIHPWLPFYLLSQIELLIPSICPELFQAYHVRVCGIPTCQTSLAAKEEQATLTSASQHKVSCPSLYTRPSFQLPYSVTSALE